MRHFFSALACLCAIACSDAPTVATPLALPYREERYLLSIHGSDSITTATGTKPACPGIKQLGGGDVGTYIILRPYRNGAWEGYLYTPGGFDGLFLMLVRDAGTAASGYPVSGSAIAVVTNRYYPTGQSPTDVHVAVGGGGITTTASMSASVDSTGSATRGWIREGVVSFGNSSGASIACAPGTVSFELLVAPIGSGG
jgi:hypothetical protein